MKHAPHSISNSYRVFRHWRGALAAAALSLLVSCGGGGGASEIGIIPGVSNQGIGVAVDTVGGTVADGAGASVSVPANALMSVSANVAITSSPFAGTAVPISVQGSATAISRKYILTQDSGFNFSTPVIVTLPYDSTGLNQNSTLIAAYFDTALAQWVPFSNGVDDRSAGTFTFSTKHFTPLIVLEWLYPSTIAAWDTGFNPEFDGIPITNFGTAVSPDGSTKYEDGSCGGMVGLAGWYFQYKMKASGPASSRFSDDLATRSLIAMLHSKFRTSFDASLITHGYVTATSDVKAASKIRDAIFRSGAPVIAYVQSNPKDMAGHYVLIYRYEGNTFYFYDPSVKKNARTFTATAQGTLENWTYLGLPVTHFHLSGVLDESIDKPDLDALYESYLNHVDYATWGKFTDVSTGLSIAGNATRVVVSGKLSTAAKLAGRDIYIHFLAPKSALTHPAGGPESNNIVLVDQIVSDPLDTGTPIGHFSPGSTATFSTTLSAGQFKEGQRVTLTMIASTNRKNYFGGQWAYGEVSFDTLSVATCTPPQVPSNGTCANPPTITNGLCGSAKGVAVASAPSGSNLCSVGMASTVTATSTGPWSWSCAGSNGGTPESCTAPKANTAPALSITTSSLPTAAVGTGYSQGVTATGGQAPYSWSASGLPSGLSISSTSGSISGTPTAPGTFSVTVTATDSSSPVKTAPKALSLTVSPPATAALSITTTAFNPSTATVGVGYGALAAVTATGGQTPYSWSATGLPSGLSINSSSGSISGTPTASGTFSVTVTVTDSSSPQKSSPQVLSLNVVNPPTSLLATTLTAPVNNATDQTLTPTLQWSGGSAQYWQVNVLNTATLLTVHTSPSLPASQMSYIVPSGVLQASAQYRWSVTACPDAACNNSATNKVSNGLSVFGTAAAVTAADLLPQSVAVNPNPAIAGSAVTVSYNVRNQGGTNAPPSHTKVQIKNASGTLLTEQIFVTSAIAANSSVSETHSISLLGASNGIYYAYVIVDNTQSEVVQSDYSNDGLLAAGVSFTVQSAVTSADLVPQSVSVNPSVGTAGGTITVGYTIANTGGTAALASETDVQITDTAGNPLLPSVNLKYSTPAIPANSSIPESRSITLPAGAAAGAYKVYVMVDFTRVAGQGSANLANDTAVGSFTVAASASNYGGTYACTVSGNDTGTFTAVAPSPSGSFTSCSGNSFNGGPFVCTGSVSASGVIANAIASLGTTATGTANATGASGTWSNIGASGTFACTRGTTLTPQTITFNQPANQTIGVAPPALLATSTSGQIVSFNSSPQSVCTVSGTTLTLVSTGTCTINATQAGGSGYAAAIAVSRSLTVQPAITAADLLPQSVAVNPNPAIAGSTVTVSYNVRNQGGTNASPSHTRVLIQNSLSVVVGDQTFTTSGIAANTAVSEVRSMALTSSNAGTYYAYVVVDALAEVLQGGATANDGQLNAGVPFTVQVPLKVNGIASSYLAPSNFLGPIPYYLNQVLSGSGFLLLIGQPTWSCSKADGTSCGPIDGRMDTYSDSTGTLFMTMTVNSASTYNLSVTFAGAGQSVTKNFTVKTQ